MNKFVIMKIWQFLVYIFSTPQALKLAMSDLFCRFAFFSTKVFHCLDGHAFFYTHTIINQGPCMHASRDEMVCLITKRINGKDGTVLLGHTERDLYLEVLLVA
jgi:hypothetical protein